MGVAINLLLTLTLAVTLILAWFLSKRFGLIASVLGAAAIFGTSYGLVWLAPVLGVHEPEAPWNLSVLGATSIWLIVLGWVFAIGSVGGLVRRLWSRLREASTSTPDNGGSQ